MIIEGYCPAVKQPFPASGGLGLCLIPYLGCSRKVLVATLGLSRASVCSCESNQLAKMVSQTPSAMMCTGLCYFACAQQLLQPLERSNSSMAGGRVEGSVCGLR